VARYLHAQAYGEEDYIIFDCPGQIELYSHVSVFRSFVDFLRRDAWSVAAVYCIDCQFVGTPTKFIAGSLQAMSAMVQLELPHVNVLTKVDLLGDENKVRWQQWAAGSRTVFHVTCWHWHRA
jgi:GTPase SAR1 family protein